MHWTHEILELIDWQLNPRLPLHCNSYSMNYTKLHVSKNIAEFAKAASRKLLGKSSSDVNFVCPV